MGCSKKNLSPGKGQEGWARDMFWGPAGCWEAKYSEKMLSSFFFKWSRLRESRTWQPSAGSICTNWVPTEEICLLHPERGRLGLGYGLSISASDSQKSGISMLLNLNQGVGTLGQASRWPLPSSRTDWGPPEIPIPSPSPPWRVAIAGNQAFSVGSGLLGTSKYLAWSLSNWGMLVKVWN